MIIIIMTFGNTTILLFSLAFISSALAENQETVHVIPNTPTSSSKWGNHAPIETFTSQSQGASNPSSSLKFKYFIFEEKCYDTFFIDKDFLNFPCLKLTISKFVGYALVYGSLIVKAPQILKILLNCSILGISFSSIIIEALMYSLMMGYNIHKGYPFSIYGENVFLGASNVFIVGCFFLFCKEKRYGYYAKGSIILLAVAVPLICQMTPTVVIENSLWLGMIAFLLSRYEQIRENYKNKSTGNLSFLTTFLNFGGNIARSFTILTEASGDILYLFSNLMPIMVNGFILVQFLMYWNNAIEYEDLTEKRSTEEIRMSPTETIDFAKEV